MKLHKKEADIDDSENCSVDAEDTESSSESGEEYVTPKRLKRVAKKRVGREKEKEKKKEHKRVNEKISKDDFYNKNLEFRSWLLDEKKKLFDGMSSDKAKELFKKFVKKWNARKLPKKYYRGVDVYDTPSKAGYRLSFAESSSSDLSNVRSNVASWNSPPSGGENTAPSTPFSTFGKDTSVKAGSFKKCHKPVFTETLPKADPQDTESEVGFRAIQDTKHDPKVFLACDIYQDKHQTGKRSCCEIKEKTVLETTKKIQAYQEEEKQKMKALLEMSRSAKSANVEMWKEHSSEDQGSGYFRV